MKFALALTTLFSFLLINISSVFAISDPLSIPNNKFGIHITNPDFEKISEASQLINSNGDWGYVTVVMANNNIDLPYWQNIFNELRRTHLIPIVRIATHGEGNHWVRPEEGEENKWANILDKLYWPVKNRYVVIYNEPNNALEWGSTVDAKNYAEVLNKTIDALKSKNPNFFVMNAGLDASAPQKLPAYQDELEFLKEMNQSVPGIFNKLDGWVSHSYPQPEYRGSPKDTGRGTIKTWEWELQVLKQLGLTKNIPVFITETGWKHAEGIKYDSSFPNSEKTGEYYKEAYQNVWNNSQIAAVTPFFNQFSGRTIRSLLL